LHQPLHSNNKARRAPTTNKHTHHKITLHRSTTHNEVEQQLPSPPTSLTTTKLDHCTTAQEYLKGGEHRREEHQGEEHRGEEHQEEEHRGEEHPRPIAYHEIPTAIH
jgi:hypothetical protein